MRFCCALLTVPPLSKADRWAAGWCKLSSEMQPEVVKVGHASGRLALAQPCVTAGWQMDKAILSRSARVLMSGWVHV